MRLLIDAGNSRLKWAVADGSGLLETGQLPRAAMTGESLASLFSRFGDTLSSVWVANVAGPEREQMLRRAGGDGLAGRWHFVQSQASCLGVRNGYRDPAQLGVDRWVAILAGFHAHGGPLCVVDAGTALTLDAVDAGGQHLGGVIVPGLALMKASLRKDTSEIDSRAGGGEPAAEDLFAHSTLEAISAGSVLALAGLIERAVAEITRRVARPVLVLTGGDAVRLGKYCKLAHHVMPHLVLEGLNLMAESAP